eukprot:2909127-Prorocentrum_lima.AAC.1
MAMSPEQFSVLPFSVEGVNTKIAKLEEVRSRVVEAFRLAEEIEDDCYIPYWHEQDSDSSPRSIGPTMSDYEFEEWSVESKVNNKARDLVYLMKHVGHYIDVLQVQLGTCFDSWKWRARLKWRYLQDRPLSKGTRT